MIQEDKSRGQKFTTSGKFYKTKENKKLKTETSPNKRTIALHLLGPTVLCKTVAQKSPP